MIDGDLAQLAADGRAIAASVLVDELRARYAQYASDSCGVAELAVGDPPAAPELAVERKPPGVAEESGCGVRGGVDLPALRETLARLDLSGTRAPLTVRGYESDWTLFDRWCRQAGKQSLPASEDTVRLYLAWLLEEKGRKTTTAERHLQSVAHRHRQRGLQNPISSSVRDTLLAIRRQRKERPQGKKALSVGDLVRISEACDTLTNRGLRDRALIVLGFATSLRRSNLGRLQLSDLSFHEPGLAVHVRSSKNDQNAVGKTFAAWAGERASTDPVTVVQAWIDARGKWSGPLFTRVTSRGDHVSHSGISGDSINKIVQRAMVRAGLDPTGYGAHSLRAGAITASAELGRSDQEIMGLSGHSSVTVMRTYIRGTRLFAGRNPLAGAM